MKKIITVALSCFSILFLSYYLFIGTGSASDNYKQEKNKVSFENAKLVDSKIDERSGVQIDVYTVENGNKKN